MFASDNFAHFKSVNRKKLTDNGIIIQYMSTFNERYQPVQYLLYVSS